MYSRRNPKRPGHQNWNYHFPSYRKPVAQSNPYGGWTKVGFLHCCLKNVNPRSGHLATCLKSRLQLVLQWVAWSLVRPDTLSPTLIKLILFPEKIFVACLSYRLGVREKMTVHIASEGVKIYFQSPCFVVFCPVTCIQRFKSGVETLIFPFQVSALTSSAFSSLSLLTKPGLFPVKLKSCERRNRPVLVEHPGMGQPGRAEPGRFVMRDVFWAAV